ncbi:MAG: radical SAM protein [Nitrospirota bacterium]
MNVLIIATNRNTLPMPVMPMGACMVAEAAERAGHRVRLLDLMFEKDALRVVRSGIAASKPDVIGLSVRNIDNNDMASPVFFISELAALTKAVRAMTDAPIILGGAALSVMPEEILRSSGASLGVLGDGEVVFPGLLEVLARGKPVGGLEGIMYRENGAFHKTPCVTSGFSSDCAAPDYRRWVNISAYRSHMATAPLQTKLGCQFQCVYCTYRKIEGSTYRLSDPASVADAAARLASSGQRDIEFVDSVFNAPYDHAVAVCEALARSKQGARLQSLELNPRYFDDALVAAMERSGFVGMGITVESASDRVLQGLRKGFTSREVHRAAEVVRRHRIPCAWIFLLGGPGETGETVRETLRFAETRIGPRDVAFFNIGIRVYPGTELETIARNQGALSVPRDKMLAPVFYVSPDVDAGWIAKELRKSMAGHMNFISSDSIGLSFLPLVHRAAYRLGLRSPLWRHTRFIRRGLRLVGMDV